MRQLWRLCTLVIATVALAATFAASGGRRKVGLFLNITSTSSGMPHARG